MTSVSSTIAPLPRTRRRFLKRAILVLIALGCVGFLLSGRREVPLAAPFSDPAVAQAIVAAAPPGWRLVRTDRDQLPRGQHWDDEYRKHWHGGEELTLAGPTKIAVSVPPKEIEAIESLELWILPSTYPDGSLSLDLFGCQIADRIFRDGSVTIYALTSRYDGTDDLDSMCGDVYSETSILRPPTKGLPISWKSYRTDIAGALRH
jgi:hypothetical protein